MATSTCLSISQLLVCFHCLEDLDSAHEQLHCNLNWQLSTGLQIHYMRLWVALQHQGPVQLRLRLLMHGCRRQNVLNRSDQAFSAFA